MLWDHEADNHKPRHGHTHRSDHTDTEHSHTHTHTHTQTNTRLRYINCHLRGILSTNYIFLAEIVFSLQYSSNTALLATWILHKFSKIVLAINSFSSLFCVQSRSRVTHQRTSISFIPTIPLSRVSGKPLFCRLVLFECFSPLAAI